MSNFYRHPGRAGGPPLEVRYRRGRASPEGFYLDSCDYTALRRYLFDPLEPRGSGVYRSAAFYTRRAPFQRAHYTRLVHSKTIPGRR
jgi:hypothetical protein